MVGLWGVCMVPFYTAAYKPLQYRCNAPMVFNLVLSWIHIKYPQGVLPIPLWLIPQGMKYKPKFEHP